MIYSSLNELIKGLEFGNKVHISVVFLKNYGNSHTELEYDSMIHSKPICSYMKTRKNELSACMKYRDMKIKRAANTKKSVGEICICGIYEYTRPVFEDEKLAAVIFVGNIKPGKEESQKLESYKADAEILETLEENCDEEQAEKLADLVENHIHLLLKEFSNEEIDFSPMVRNVKNYIKENFSNDFSIEEIAETFSYNAQYLGRLFKTKTGITINEYINKQKLKAAEELIEKSELQMTEIALRSGFNSVTYFNKLFKMKHGISPTKYRKIYEK